MHNFWSKLKKPIIALAPMAGITDSAWRRICRQQGADVVYSEMTSVDGLFYKSKKTLALLKFYHDEKPLVIQLFGKDPKKFGQAVKLIERAGADGIDINFGCPAKKVVTHGGGVTLMRDLDLCYEIIKQTIINTQLPVSVKIRTAINSRAIKKVTALDFLKSVANLPLAAVMIHGRSYEQGFSGPIDYQMILQAKKYFKGIILANGGVVSPETARELLLKTQADGLGIARGCLGNPWIFQQIKDYLINNKFSDITWTAKKKIILNHAKLAFKTKGQHGLIELRKHLLWYVKGIANAKDYRQKLVRVEKMSEIKNILNEIKK